MPTACDEHGSYCKVSDWPDPAPPGTRYDLMGDASVGAITVIRQTGGQSPKVFKFSERQLAGTSNIRPGVRRALEKMLSDRGLTKHSSGAVSDSQLVAMVRASRPPRPHKMAEAPQRRPSLPPRVEFSSRQPSGHSIVIMPDYDSPGGTVVLCRRPGRSAADPIVHTFSERETLGRLTAGARASLINLVRSRNVAGDFHRLTDAQLSALARTTRVAQQSPAKFSEGRLFATPSRK